MFQFWRLALHNPRFLENEIEKVQSESWSTGQSTTNAIKRQNWILFIFAKDKICCFNVFFVLLNPMAQSNFKLKFYFSLIKNIQGKGGGGTTFSLINKELKIFSKRSTWPKINLDFFSNFIFYASLILEFLYDKILFAVVHVMELVGRAGKCH